MVVKTLVPMRRFVLASVIAAVSSTAHAQPVDLSVLGLGPIFAVRAVELDGAPGREYIVKTVSPLTITWVVVYPQNPDGLCTSLPFALGFDQIDDFNGDGKDERMRVDIAAQTVTFTPLPVCQG